MKHHKEHEIEIKFYLANPEAFEKRILDVGGKITQARTHEHNLRFDTPDGELSASYQVLRLRQDEEIRLTYKGASDTQDGVAARREIEFRADDFEAAKDLLEALGYQVSVVYEKYRTTYALGEVEVMVDEMPFGAFTEIEGPDSKTIQEAAKHLGLKWENRITMGYMQLFKQTKERLGLSFRDLTFENFKEIEVSGDTLGAKPADNQG